ncbi:YadA-like family protein [Halomonas binhaiensis]|uniref:YadA-like family protein n=1 Tax=Halomonas binhaiensis TaxID=2562282 RepID=UPI001F072738|nr:YadA-like family protein [Halomonas binhaiensis]
MVLLPGSVEEAKANTLDDGSQICNSTGSTGTVGRQQYGQTNSDPEDGSGTFSTVAGCNAQGNNHLAATVYGTFSQATGQGSAVFGFSSYAGKWATSIGLQNGAGGTASTALGFGTQAAGLNSVAIGGAGGDGTTPLQLESSTRAIGAHSIAIGGNNIKGAQARGANSISIGSQANTEAASALAIGHAASATVDRGVALGYLSNANTGAGIRGLDPNTGVAAADGTAIANTEGTAGAVSIGNPGSGIRRQITGVAAGTNDTDAVNLAQLKAVEQSADGSWNLTAEGANSSEVASGDTVDLANNDGNIEVSKSADSDNVTFDLADDLNANSLTLGDETQSTTLNGNGLTIANGPSVTTDGIDAGGDVISNVGDGVADSDAVNVGQLNEAADGVDDAVTAKGLNFAGNEGDEIHRDLGQTLAISGEATSAGDYSGANLKTVTDPTTGAIQLQLAESPKFGDVTINTTDADGNGAGTINGLSNTTFDEDNIVSGQAATEDQLAAVNQTANTGWNISAEGENASNVAPGDTVDLANNDGNIEVSKSADSDNVTFDLADDFNANSLTLGDETQNTTLNGNGLTIANGPSVTSDGIDAAGDVISNVGDGVADSDAVNVGQLNETADGVDDAVTAKGLNFAGNEGGEIHRDLGQTLAISGEATSAGDYNGANLKTVTDPTTGAIQLQLAESPKFGDVTINTTDADGNGAGTINGLSNTTFDEDNIVSGQAATEDQLAAVNQTANTGWNVSAEGENASNVAPGDTVDLANNDGNIEVSKSADSDNVTFDLADDLNANSLTLGDETQSTTLNGNGLTIANGPSVTTDGIDAGGDVISNVGDGVADSDAVNVGQLNEAADGVDDAVTAKGLNFAGNEGGEIHRDLGQTLAISGEATSAGDYSGANLKTVTDPTTGAIQLQLAESPKFGDVTINTTDADGNGAGTINGLSNTTFDEDNIVSGQAATEDQLAAVNQTANTGWNISAEGENASNVAPGDTVDLANNDGNIEVSKSADSDNVTFDLADDLNANSLTLGDETQNTTLNGNGLTIANGPSVTTDGIDAGGDVISNVGDGVADSDAVNVGQLNEAADGVDDAVTAKGLNFAGNEGGEIHRDLGQTLAISGEATSAGDYSGANLKTVTDPTTGAIQLQLAESPKFGDVTINTTDADGNGAGTINGLSNTTFDEDNIVSGQAATEDQLAAVNQTANTGWNVSAEGENASNVAPGDTVDLANNDGNIEVSKSADSNDVTFDLADDLSASSLTLGDETQSTTLNGNGLTIANGPSVTSDGIDAAGDVISNVGDGVADSDAVNVGQLNEAADGVDNAVTAKGLNFAGNEGGEIHRDLGQTLAISGEATSAGDYSGANLKTVTDPATGAIQLQLAESPKFGDVTINTTDADGNGAGTINGLSNTTFDEDNIVSGQAATEDQLAAVNATANTGWNVSAEGENASNVAPGDTVDLANNDGNIEVSKSADSNDVTFDLADDLNASSLTLGDETQSTTLNGNGLTIANGPSVTSDGIDAAGDVISNVSDGVADSDAVNVGQLNEAADGVDGAVTAKGLNFAGNEGGEVHRDLGQSLAISGEATSAGDYSGANLKTVTDPATGAIQLQLAESPKFGDVTINTTDADGNGAGTINGLSNTTFDADNITSGQAATEDQLARVEEIASSGWQLGTINGNGGVREGRELDDVTNIDPGEVAVLSNNDPNIGIAMDGNEVVFSLADDLSANSITLGDDAQSTILDGSGLSIANGPSVTTDGIDAGNQKITNVSAGEQDTDAVNVGQLNQAVTESTELVVKYDSENKDTVTLEGEEGTSITNLADGRISEQSTDAINGSQLYATNQVINELGDAFTFISGSGDTINLDEMGVGIRYARTNETGLEQSDSFAEAKGATAVGYEARSTGEQALALGYQATAAHQGSVALGAGAQTAEAVGTASVDINGQSYMFAGADPVATVSVGRAGAERTITHVAAGRISADSTDAINGSQLYATNQAVSDVASKVNNVTNEVNELSDQAVKYDSNDDGTTNHDSITLKGSGGTTIANLADGEVSEDSTDAVNGSQLWDVQNQITNIEQGGSRYFKANSNKAEAVAVGRESVAAGPQSVARADDSSAIGARAEVTAEGGVALGADSVADREGMNGKRERFSNAAVGSSKGAVSVGSAGNERQITHVAGGTQATDAVNVRQLEAVQAGAVNYDRRSDGSTDYTSVTFGNGGEPTRLRNVAPGVDATDAANVGQLQEMGNQFNHAISGVYDKIDEVEEGAYAGVASALAAASTPQATMPGKSMVSAGGGYYNGESAVAVGVSRLSDNGRWVVKANATGDSQSNFGAGVGVGWHW